MNSITIITVVVVALLTVVIFGLAWLGWGSCLKIYKLEVDQGKHDDEITKEPHPSGKSKKGLISLIGSYLILLALSGLFVTGLIYRVGGENFTINNQTALVIKSGSMSEFYSEELAERYRQLHYNLSLQFDVGDLCVFEKVASDASLVEGEVYGYRSKDLIITHRLVKEPEKGLYWFRGDNNPVEDSSLVQRSDVVYHYVGKKVPGIGAFVLYAQSYFGIWSLLGIIGITISSEVVYHKISKINKERDLLLSRSEKLEAQEDEA